MTSEFTGWPYEYERDTRASDAPPCDGLAECVVLWHALFYPESIPTVDLGPLLTFPEHRELWACLKHAYAQVGSESPAFYLAWLKVLEQRQPTKWRNYLDLILSVPNRQATRAIIDCDDDPRRHILSDHFREYAWWLARLKRIAEARAIIGAAQQIAERAWRVPERDYDPKAATLTLEESLRRLAGVTRPPTVWDMDEL